MDPLSIAASTVPLLEVAGCITKTLYKLINSFRTAETRIVGLCEELSNLTTFLQTVDKTLKGYGALDFALVEEDLWREIDQALVNCQLSLGDLCRLVEKIRSHTRSKGFGWKTRAVADLAIYDSELAAFRDKIHKSNWALQTILSTINVSLSLRSNTSQTKILSELSKLKSSFEEALRVSRQPVGGFSQHFTQLSDVRLARNLWHLAEAAKHFHSAASSTASTIRATDSNASVRQLSRTSSSLAGDFPRSKRERVEQFLRQGRCQSPDILTPPETESRKTPDVVSIQKTWMPSSHTNVSDSAPQVVERRDSNGSTEEDEYDDDDDEDDSDFEQDYISGLCELATESIKALDFGKAVRLLSRVLASDAVSSETAFGAATLSNATTRTMKIQLAICYFLEGSWEKAEPLVTELARSKASRDLVVCNLLHALAIAYLAEDKTDDALATCQQAFLVKKRLYKKHATSEHSKEYHESLGLLHAVFDASDDPIRAEIFQRQLPADFEYHHYSDAQTFVAQHQSLLRALFTLEPGAFVTPLVFEGNPQTTKKPTRARRANSTQGIATIEPDVQSLRGDADDELSPISPQSMKRGLNRFLGLMIPRRTSRETLASPSSAKPDTPPHGLTRHRPQAAGSKTRAKKFRTVLKKRPGLNHTTEAERTQKPIRWRRQDTSEDESSGNLTPLDNDAAFTTRGDFLRTEAGQDQRTFVAELADTSRPPELPCSGIKRIYTVYRQVPFRPNAHQEFQTWYPGAEMKSQPKPRIQVNHQVSGPARAKHSLEQVASAFASISAAKDPDHRHAIKLELEILYRDLVTTSNDRQLLCDIDSAIKSLTSLEVTNDSELDDSGYESAEPKTPLKQPSPGMDNLHSASPTEGGIEGRVQQLDSPIRIENHTPESLTTDVKFEPWSPGLGRTKHPERTFKGPMDKCTTKSTISDPKTLEELSVSNHKPWLGPDIYSKEGDGMRLKSWTQFAKRYLPAASRGDTRAPT